jgi:hypothetical protein
MAVLGSESGIWDLLHTLFVLRVSHVQRIVTVD